MNNIQFQMQIWIKKNWVVISFILLILLNFSLSLSDAKTNRSFQERRVNLSTVFDASDSVNSIEYSPDGQFLAVERQIKGEHYLTILDAATFAEKGEIQGRFRSPISWSWDGNYVAIRYNTTMVALVDIETVEIVQILVPNNDEDLSSNNEVLELEWSQKGNLLGIGGGFGSGFTQIWNMSNEIETPLKVFEEDGATQYISFKSDGTVFVSGNKVDNVTFWDVNTFSIIRSFMVGDFNGYIDWATDSDLIILGYEDNFNVYNFEKDEYENRNIIDDIVSATGFAIWSYDGNYIAYSYRKAPYSSDDNKLQILDYKNNEIIYRKDLGEDGTRFSWHPSNKVFAMIESNTIVVVELYGKSSTLWQTEKIPGFNLEVLIISIIVLTKIKHKTSFLSDIL